ncbi:MAG: hypothetical protein CO182_00630, partial [Lysobacterales bacterium CG_4_9_14_3_um_filter_62_6]
ITQAPWQLPSYNPDETGQAALLSSDHQRIGFTGYQKDPATGLYYAGARWYDPLIGNFNGMDPAFGKPESPISFNKYLYANGNPLAFIDIDGRENTSAQAMRFFELSHTSNPAREAELRQQIGPEAIRANARFAATLGFAQDTATGLADLAKDLGKVALESQYPGLDLGGASAIAERVQALGSAVRHPIDTFITPIRDNSRRAAELDAQGQTFEAELARQKAVIGTAEVVSLLAGGAGAVRRLTTTRGLATSANQTANQAANLERRLALNPDNDFGPVSQPRPLSGAATPPAPTNAIGAGAGTANGARVVELPAGGTGAAAQNTVGGAFTAQLEGGGAWLMSENKYRRFVEGKGLVGRADGQFMTS